MAGYQSPYGYNPYTGQVAYFNQPYQQSQQQNPINQQMQASNGSLMTVFIDNEEAVNDYPVAAGLTVQLISFKLGKFWLKSTATNGVPQQVRSFSFKEDTQPAQIQNDSVSRDEFNALNAKLEKLLKELGGDS